MKMGIGFKFTAAIAGIVIVFTILDVVSLTMANSIKKLSIGVAEDDIPGASTTRVRLSSMRPRSTGRP